MRRISFRAWLEHRVEEVPDSANLALSISQSGAGISLDQLRRVAGIRPEVLDELLQALITAGQVVALNVGGERVYRATMWGS
jgi:hypothetical protein